MHAERDEHADPARRRAPGPLWPLLLLVLGATLDGLACGLTGGARVPPVEAGASMAFAEAQLSLRAGDLEAARAELERVRALAPDWVAPRRALDDLARRDLLAAEVLEGHRGRIRAEPGDAAAWYLAGRLEGGAGTTRFERAVDLDPGLAWGHHGLAWSAHLAGDTRRALRGGRRALERARDTWERTYFTVALARYELALGRADRARRHIEERLSEPDVLAFDRVTLECWLARAEMQAPSPMQVEHGFQRAMRLLVDDKPTEDELRILVSTMVENGVGRRRRELLAQINAALASADDPARRRLRAELSFEGGSRALALAILEDGAEASGVGISPRPAELRSARFARGQGREAIESWVADLPGFVLDERGLPRDERLRSLAVAARSGDAARVGAALVEAGWFEEARGLAEWEAAHDLDLALELDARASAGLALLGGVARLLGIVDRGQAHAGPWAQVSGSAGGAPGGRDASHAEPRPIDSLEELLRALEPLFRAYGRSRGDDGSGPSLVDSPRTTYGPAAVVVHPGPTYTSFDERSGLGRAGEPVGGLAAELERLGRFGIFGQAVGGGGPDGTILRRVLVEERGGEHLGVPWSGIVAWCEGADVRSRPGRRGARISGAALHEGYWVDIDAVRAELGMWRQLQARFLGPDATPGLLERVLAGRGLTSPSGEIGRLAPLVGEGDRVRLAVLADRRRGAGRRRGDLVSLEELLGVTATHEEGHLCDRARFLPLSRNLLEVLGLLIENGFSPGRVARALEYRAQLVALCEVADPRIPLADCLSAAERGGEATPHAAAYAELLVDWVGVFARELRAGPERFPEIDDRHLLVHQLHHLGSEDVRRISYVLAGRGGLIRRR